MKLFPLVTMLGLVGCTSIVQTSANLPDGQTLQFTSYHDENGIDDTKALIVQQCDKDGCSLISVTAAYEPGILKLVAPAAVMAGGFVGGEALRRPSVTNMNGGATTASGTASATGGAANAATVSGTKNTVTQ